MNYIKTLQAEVQKQRAEIELLKTGLHEIKCYVNSTKFAGENNDKCNVRDIDLRVGEILNAASDHEALSVERWFVGSNAEILKA
jgi:hypothetical protein